MQRQLPADIFVTGSADGLGQMAARLMVGDGHRVVLHARNETWTKEALAAVPGAETTVVGDLSSIAECRQIAAQVNALGTFDAAIHNTNRKPAEAPTCRSSFPQQHPAFPERVQSFLQTGDA